MPANPKFLGKNSSAAMPQTTREKLSGASSPASCGACVKELLGRAPTHAPPSDVFQKTAAIFRGRKLNYLSLNIP